VNPLSFVRGGTEVRLSIKAGGEADALRWTCPPEGMSIAKARRQLRDQLLAQFLDRFLPEEQETPR
jgi:hypothetical protein